MKPFFSVITITYKDSLGLQKTIDSLKPLCSQKDLSWEHVIVDSSPELNEEVLSKIPENWPTRYFVDPPKGPYPAFNSGVLNSSGEVLQFINGGDWLLNSEALIGMLMRMKAESRLELICAGATLYRDKIPLYDRLPQANFLSSILGMNRLCHQSMLYRRNIFDRIGLFSTEYKVASDYEHHFKCYFNKINSICLNESIVSFEMGGLSDNFKLAFSEFKKIHKKMGSMFPFFTRIQNDLMRRSEFGKVVVIKLFANSVFASTLRPVWIWWNRRKKTLSV